MSKVFSKYKLHLFFLQSYKVNSSQVFNAKQNFDIEYLSKYIELKNFKGMFSTENLN